MKIVCLGDSITYGYGVNRKQVWTALAAEETGWEIVNAGVSGDTTGGMLARFVADVRGEQPDVVFIMGGGNDHMAGCPAYVMQSNVMATAQQAVSLGMRAVIGVPPPTDLTRMPPAWKPLWTMASAKAEYRQYTSWLPVFAAGEPIGLIDFETPLIEKVQMEPGKWLIDGIHWTPEGQRLLCDVFVAGMRAFLKARAE